MSIVLGLWYVFTRRYPSITHFYFRHLILEGGKEKTIHTPANVQITNASFGEEIVDQSRTVVKLTFDTVAPSYDSDEEDEEKEQEEETTTTVLCSLTPGKVRSYMSTVEQLLNYLCF